MDAEAIELAVLKMQVDRIVSDIESEKATRSRVNMELMHRIDESDNRTAEKIEELDRNQRRSDRLIYMMLGGIAVIQFVSAFLHQ